MGATINLEYYTGTDHYSDGDIENELLEIVKNNHDFTEILRNDDRWPILYHLSPIRQNIINWYPFKDNASCLEIGGGCGAITGALCQSLQEVKVVELSKRRATINYERHKEYAGSFTKTDQPYEDFLKQIKQYLKPDGKLIIAIENRYGLKYFSGAKEDHTSKEFDGITGYKDNDTVCTFGKKELEVLLSKSGYPNQDFYYPHPDYKMPMEIYSSDWLPSSTSQLTPAPNFDYERYELFNETDAYKGIIENGQYEFFANSFLVICGD